MLLRSLLSAVVASLICHTAFADSAIEPLFGFEMGPNPNGATVQARASLYLHTDGQFYGTSPGGGAFSLGTLFQMSKSGIFGHLSFAPMWGSLAGTTPVSTPVLSSDGWLWGTTSAGGATSTFGTIFRFRPETGEVQTMHNFATSAGNSPVCGLTADGQGYLWGVTRYTSGATSSHGILFRIHELTGVFEMKASFNDTGVNKGRVPQGALYYEAAGNNLWGTTSTGGNGYGTIFKYNITSGTLTTVAQFSGTSTSSLKGDGAAGALVSDGNGFLWGVTAYGGNSSTSSGTIFKVEMATGTASTVIEFSGTGATNKGALPIGPLVNDGAGNLWGVTNTGALGSNGSVFKIASSTGVLTTVLQLGSLTGANATVRYPLNGLTNDGEGNLWGLASVGGGAATWAVYKIKMSDGSFTKVAEQQPGGISYKGRTPLAGLSGNATTPWLWGTTSVGGANNLGTLFRYNPSTRQHNTVVSFTGQTGTALGSKPNGKVHVAADGIVWGTTEEGGASNLGTIFKYDPATSTFTTVQSFSSAGIRPMAPLTGMSDGTIWGTTSNGLSGNGGTVFKIETTTSVVTVVHSFSSSTAAEGYQLRSGVAEDSGGFVWGTTTGGGTNNNGTLFKINRSSGAYSVASSFANGIGSVTGDLVVDAAGNIYGTHATSLFKFVPGTSTLTTIFTPEELTPPLKGLTTGTLFKTAAGEIRFLGTEGTRDLASPNQFFTSPRAVIYQINTSTGAVTKVRSLMEGVVGPTTPAELTPAGGLYEHTDGRFYGLSQSGGTNEDLEPAGGGMLYRVGSGPSVMTQRYNSATTTAFYTLVSNNTVTLRGYANPNGNSILCEFEWGPTSKLGNKVSASATPGTGFTGNLCEAVLTGLPANTTYFFRLRANTNGQPDAPAYGPVQTIVTGAQASYPATAEISVESPIGQSLTDNTGTLDLGSLLVGQAIKQAVAVRNLSGTANLTGVSASITGANASDFVITTPLTLTSIGPGGSDGLIITFAPSGSGIRSATLTILSNDSDEASFEVQLTGEGLVQPEIEVDTAVATNVQSNEASYDYGTSSVSAGIARTFTIRNVGNAALNSLNVTVDGANSSDFVVTTQPATSIAQGSSGTFVVTFTPSVGGARNARLQIASNDSDENPFNINLSGSGIVAPEIEVLDDSVELTDNVSTIAFGSLNTGALSTRVITIRNAGSAALTGISLSFFSGDSTHFQVGTVASSVAAGQQITFNLSFFPQSAGAKSTTLRIASNDSNENPFDIILTGTGTTAPEISVESPLNTPLTDGVSSLDFGSVTVGSSGTKTVYIRNPGSANLTGLSVSFTGTHASDFSATTPGSTTVTPSDATGFVLTFTPSGGDARTATMHIASNDEDENPFDIALTGSGNVPLAPTFTVQPQSQLVLLGQPASFNPTVTGAAVMTYRWKKGTSFITNATASSYGITVTKAADAAAYSVVADNPVGDPVTSATAFLGLVTPNSGSQVLKIGSTLKLTCTVVAPKVAGVSVKYDWFRQGSLEPITNGTKANAAVVTGATTGALSIAKIGTADAGLYTCRVTLDTPGNDPTLTPGETAVSVVDAVPVMNPIPLPATASISEKVDVTVSASNLPISYSVVGLPKGLKLDTKTGRITGRPSVASKKNTQGDYIPQKITFKARNVLNEGPGLDFYMVIEPLDANVVGTFSGVVGRSSHSNFGMGGLVQITVGSTGAVSGSATLAGQKHKVVGTLDGDLEDRPEASLLIKRSPSSLGNLEMTLSIDGSTRVMSGSIRDPRFELLQGALDLGNSAEPGLINGSMAEARFRSPRGIALLLSGSGYIADSGNHVIRFINTTTEAVTTLAGSGSAGAADGTGSAASFSSPEGLALDKLGNLFVADTGNATIRKITPAGVVTTFAGSAGQTGTSNGTGSAARFSQPCALCFDTSGNLYVADRGNHLIRKVTPAGVVTTLAGKANTAEHKDGSGSLAIFNTPRGITYDPVLKALFVADSLNRVIRKVTLTGKVTTYAGAPKTEGAAEGLFANTRFIEPLGIASLGDGTLIVTDTLLVQLNRNGTSGIISERLDPEGSSDHPAAVAQNPADRTLIAVHDTLHSIASYSSAEEETRLEAPFEARRSLSSVPTAEQGLYNAALITTAEVGDVTYPQGSGYAQLSLGKTGTVNGAGKAADGSTLTFSTTLAENRSLPLHVMMYGKTGSLQGRCLINATTHDIISDSTFPMDWFKIPQPHKSTTRSYKNGFMLHALALKGGKYTPNNLHSYLGLSSSPTDMSLNFAESVNPAFAQTFTLTSPNSLSLASPARSLSLKIDPKTSIFTGSYKEGTPAVTVPFAGILIDHKASLDQSGYGHYLIPENSAATAPIRSAPVTLGVREEL